jgi:DNA mismatch repair ATPase MutS
VERIASSSALLRYLDGQNALCIAATHDMELTQLLSKYRQVHFREEITPQGMVFPYQVTEGVSTTRNAIRLLEQHAFPAQVVISAEAMAARFDATGKWDASQPQGKTDGNRASMRLINSKHHAPCTPRVLVGQDRKESTHKRKNTDSFAE